MKYLQKPKVWSHSLLNDSNVYLRFLVISLGSNKVQLETILQNYKSFSAREWICKQNLDVSSVILKLIMIRHWSKKYIYIKMIFMESAFSLCLSRFTSKPKIQYFHFIKPISLKGSRTGHFVKVSIWYASLLTNSRFRFLYFRISNC